MDNNNPYKRSYKTKREEYQEKLKNKSASQEWLFGNIFGKPGGGAPLRDNQGNVISSLKTITNGNIHKYEAQDFSKGDNNISVLNNRIYNQNNLISNQFPQSYDQTFNYSPNQNQNISFQNKRIVTISNPNIYNNYENQKEFLNQQNIPKINSINKNNILIQQQIPYGYLLPYPNVIPYNQISPTQLQLQSNNIGNNIYIPNKNINISNNIEPQINRNYSAITPKINYLNNIQNIPNNNLNNNINNNNLNISKQENYRPNNTTGNISKNSNNENENDFLLISNDNDLNNKLQNEKKLEEWKNDLRKQVEEKRKRDEEEKKKMAKEDKEEELKYQEYLQYKSRQAEEQIKKNKMKRQKYLNQNLSSNDIEQSKQTIEEAQNQNLSQNNETQSPYDISNPLNKNNIPPEIMKEQENFKNYIDQQYNTLGQSLGQNIQNEIIKMSTMLTSKYEPFTKYENANHLNKLARLNNETAVRNDKKMQKIQDILEERELLDFIIGDKDIFSPFKYKNYDLNRYSRINNEKPSYFGKNRVPNEKRFVNLDSESQFLFDDFSNQHKNETKEIKIVFSQEEYEKEKNNQNNNYNKNLNNNQSRKFGRNLDDFNNIESIPVSQSLDNKSSFVPINNDVDPNMIDNINKNINKEKEEKIKEEKEKFEKERKEKEQFLLKDKIEDNILKNLNDIDLLNKNVVLYDMDLNNNKNNKENSNINDNINNVEIKSEKSNINNQKISEKDISEINKDEKYSLNIIEKSENSEKIEQNGEINSKLYKENNTDDKKVSEIGVQSEPNEISINNKNDDKQTDNEINIKENSIKTDELNSNNEKNNHANEEKENSQK